MTVVYNVGGDHQDIKEETAMEHPAHTPDEGYKQGQCLSHASGRMSYSM